MTKDRLESAIDGIGPALSATIQQISGARAVVEHTAVGELPGVDSLPPLEARGGQVVRLQLVDPEVRTPWSGPTLFEACLDVDLTTHYDDDDKVNAGSAGGGMRDAVIDSLADVLKAAAELFDAMAHGKLLATSPLLPPLSEDANIYWARLYIEVLYAHVKASVRSAIDVAAIAEIKRYKTPPPAVTPVLTATLLLAEGQAADGLLTFDHSKLQDWAGVRSLLASFEPEKLTRAICAVEPAQRSETLWDKVGALINQTSLRDAMRCSAPLAALYRWLVCARLLRSPRLLIEAIAAMAPSSRAKIT